MRWPAVSIEVLPLLAIVCPLVGALTTFVNLRLSPGLVRPMALSNAFLTLCLLGGITALQKTPSNDDSNRSVRQMETSIVWLKDRTITRADSANGIVPRGFDIRLSFGVDGACLWPALIVAAVVIVSLLSPGRIRSDLVASYCLAIMLCEFLILASLLSSDAVSSIVFAEAFLLPGYYLVGICGGADRRLAAGRLWIWQFAGCGCTLAGVTLLAVSRPWMQSDLVPRRSQLLFDTRQLTDSIQQLLERSEVALQIWSDVAPWATVLLMMGFVIRMPVYPFQGWYESTLRTAPAGAAAVFAAALPMMAINVWLRLGFPFYAEDAGILTGTLGVAALLGLWRSALLSLGQTDLRRLLVLISTGMLCLLCLGLSTLRPSGTQGAWLIAVSHAIAIPTGILFIGLLERYSADPALDSLISILRSRRRLATILILLLGGAIGLPMVYGFAPIYAVLLAGAEQGLLMAVTEAVGMSFVCLAGLRIVRQTFAHRAADADRLEVCATSNRQEPEGDRTDVHWLEAAGFALLTALLLAIDTAPGIVANGIEPLLRAIR